MFQYITFTTYFYYIHIVLKFQTVVIENYTVAPSESETLRPSLCSESLRRKKDEKSPQNKDKKDRESEDVPLGIT